MILETTTSPPQTRGWAPTVSDAEHFRRLLTEAGHLDLEANPSELDFLGQIPDDERHEFDPSLILNVEIGYEAHGSLMTLINAGHELRWHRWQHAANRDKAWCVPIASPKT